MIMAFRAEALTLGGLLSGDRCFAVPVFQRAYSWTPREVQQLVGDLWLGLAMSRQPDRADAAILLGSVVVVDDNCVRHLEAGANKAAWVIDGKQRLTTLTVLLATLRDRLCPRAAWISDLIWRIDPASSTDAPAPRLVLGLEEDSYFGVQVRRPGASADALEPDGEHKGRLRLRECQQAIIEDLEERSDADLMALAEFLRDQVALVLISTPDIDAGFRTFMTTNTRGKPLEATDILKAELMASVPELEREQRLERWANAERALGSDFKDLPGYLRAVHGKVHGATIRDVLDLSQREGGAARFLDAALFPLAERLQPILTAAHAGSPQSDRINMSLRYLTWLRARDWVPPALAFTDRFPDRDADYAAFLERLERLAYGLQILGTGADRRQVRYRAVIDALTQEAPANGILAPLDLTADEQWTLMLNARGNLYQRSQASCKVLLRRLSASYPGDDQLTAPSDFTVEHVLPRNNSSNSPWRIEIPDAEDREACSKMLGNLVLITKQQNKEARNHPFDVKQGLYFPDGRPSPLAITNQIYICEHWRAEDIRSRDAQLLQRMTEIWNLKVKPQGKRPSGDPRGAGT